MRVCAGNARGFACVERLVLPACLLQIPCPVAHLHSRAWPTSVGASALPRAVPPRPPPRSLIDPASPPDFFGSGGERRSFGLERVDTDPLPGTFKPAWASPKFLKPTDGVRPLGPGERTGCCLHWTACSRAVLVFGAELGQRWLCAAALTSSVPDVFRASHHAPRARQGARSAASSWTCQTRHLRRAHSPHAALTGSAGSLRWPALQRCLEHGGAQRSGRNAHRRRALRRPTGPWSVARLRWEVGPCPYRER